MSWLIQKFHFFICLNYSKYQMRIKLSNFFFKDSFLLTFFENKNFEQWILKNFWINLLELGVNTKQRSTSNTFDNFRISSRTIRLQLNFISGFKRGRRNFLWSILRCMTIDANRCTFLLFLLNFIHLVSRKIFYSIWSFFYSPKRRMWLKLFLVACEPNYGSMSLYVGELNYINKWRLMELISD